jgi:hypothetical protein
MNRRLAVSGLLFAAACSSPGEIVINEIFFDPPDVTQPLEFLELHNTGPEAADLSGWFFSDGIDYVLPAGVVVAPGGFLVVAQDPDALAAQFGGESAQGPFGGGARLANDGELVVLRDAVSNKVDEVDYGLATPWPTASGGEGSSMELIHPSLDNNLGGSWRASQMGAEAGADLVPTESQAWIYRKGTNEPPDDWADPSHVPDASWMPGQAGFGYGDGDDNTLLPDMQGNYSTVYLRHDFLLAGMLPETLTLDVYHDDGAVVWINGVEVGRFSVPDGFLAFDRLAYNHEASWSSVTLTLTNTAALLRDGRNVLAVQALNTEFGSSDFSIDARLDLFSDFSPTPGLTNSVWSAVAPPQVRQVDHEPQQPAAGEPIVITAKVTDPEGIGAVMLLCQVVPPGDYLPAWQPLPVGQLMSVATPVTPQIPNPAFEAATNWVAVVMHDDGLAGDAAAGDDVYTAQVPGQINRTLLRYRVRAEDAWGEAVTLPYPDDPSLNFACFIHDGVPPYVAGARSVVTNDLPYVHGAEVLTALPVYHLLTRAEDMADCLAYDGADQLVNGHASRWVENWEGAIVYEGKVYDHVRYRLRGANGRYLMAGKRSMRIRFNRGREFEARDRYGNDYPEPWSHLDTGKMFDNRVDPTYSGNFGLAESVNAMLWNMMGVPTPNSHWFHFRVVDGAEEAPAGANGQYDGDFWGLFLATEYYDRDFLQARGLPDGNLYKLTDRIDDPEQEERVQGTEAVSDGSDYWWIFDRLNSNRSQSQLHDMVNIEKWCSYRAVMEGIRIYDFPPGYNKNEAWYFNLAERNGYNDPFGRLWLMPYDHDLSWGPNWNNGGERVYLAVDGGLSKPAIRQQLRNRIREFRDLVWTEEVIHDLLDDLAAQIADFVPADRDRWRLAPADAGRMDWGTLEAKVADMKFFAFDWDGSYNRWPGGDVSPGGDLAGSRAAYLDALAGAEGDASSIPYTPQITHDGRTGYPVNALAFLATPFADPQGANTFAAMEWRLGEVTRVTAPAYDPAAPREYEMPAVWESGELAAYTNRMVIPAGVAKVGHAYRARVRMKDDTGRWSHWSAPVAFVAVEPNTSAALRQFLRVTEVMYNPRSGEDHEFVELHNTSTDTALDLAGIAFTSGIDFTFPGGARLEPGAYLLVTGAAPDGDFAQFRAQYALGPDIAIYGPYAGRLNNAGEKLELKTAAAGEDIAEFTYGDGRGWPPAADGSGHSLVPLTMESPADGGLDAPDPWRASTYMDGSPGEPDPVLPPGLVLNELLAHTDFNDPLYPDYDSNDRIEVYNRAAESIPLAGWYLSDDGEELAKWPLPAAAVAGPGAWLDWDETTGFHQPITSGFGLDKAGETVFLSHLPGNGRDRVVDAVGFQGQLQGVSLGRFPDGIGRWAAMTPTFGAANLAPAPHILISEVMYHPVPTAAFPDDNVFDEFIEIHNPTGQAVPLWNTAGTWRISGGVDVLLPSAQSLAAGAFALFVSFDPDDAAARAVFLGNYGLSEGEVTLYGPWTGQLANSAERISLEMPQAPDLIGDPVSWIVVDEVQYGSRVDWPAAADGAGPSLERYDAGPVGFGAGSWQAVNPSGSPGQGPDRDGGGNGLPDTWEWAAFGGVGVPEGAWEDDFDGDGRSNGLEYLRGTAGQVQDAMPDLSISLEASGPVVAFPTRPADGPGYFGRTRVYTLQSAERTDGPWTNTPGFHGIIADGSTITYAPDPDLDTEAAFRLVIELE